MPTYYEPPKKINSSSSPKQQPSSSANSSSSKNFQLPPAVWLPNTSFMPVSALIFIFSALVLGGYVAFHFVVPFEVQWWMTATWLGVSSIAIAILVEFLIVRRINFLSAVIQQDPRLVAGDVVAFGLMKQLPCCIGRSREMDTLQKSLVNLYRASFKGRNVVYDGFTQRSVISCDYDVRSEQRPFGRDSEFGDDDDDAQQNWENRSWHAADDDGLEEDADRDQIDLGGGASLPASARNFFQGGKGPNSARNGFFLSGRKNGESAGGGANMSGNISGGARSLQRALLLSGVDPNLYSNPNTPRGHPSSPQPQLTNDSSASMQQMNYSPPPSASAATMSLQQRNENDDDYGSTAMNTARSEGGESNLVSARSLMSTHSCITVQSSKSHNNNNNTGGGRQMNLPFSPTAIMLAEVDPTSISASNLRRHVQSQPTWMQYDPLGDNNSSVPYHEVLMQGIPDTGTSLLVSIVRQISPGTPLSAVTFPVHILEPRSLLEKFADMFRHSGILIDAAKITDDPSRRLQEVSKFFLSAFYLQQGARKPYNPLHGEVFGARLEIPQTNGKVVHYIAEQVSHHPPVTCIRASCQGVFEFKAIYHAKTSLVSINCASSVGEGGMELILYDEQQRATSYSMQWPTLFVSGFLYGTMKLELGGTSNVVDQTSSRARAKIDFARKGWISGEYDVVQAVFSDPNSGAIDEKYGPGFEGHWNSEIYFTENRNSSSIGKNNNNSTRQVVWNGPAEKSGRASSSSSRPAPFCRLMAMNVPNHHRQSRAIWQKLTQSLRQQDVARAVAAKHEVEEAQRAWRKALTAKNQKHEPRLFRHVSQHMAQFPTQDLWDLSKWQDTDECRSWFQSHVADVQMQ